ncbi:lipid-A-disaccharide synthase [Piscinibacter sakaiensis]|uniref:lipid-A-disaccharide synthase n=1 Tax=Piscinibacter sakaiensis TaxID=1547922 RepID=UPI003AAB5A25
MVAGETSGDLLAGLLLAGLRRRWPDLYSAGIGGPKMAAHGFEAWWPHDKLAVRGYVEVLRHYRELSSIRRQLGDRLLQQRPDAFIGVDAPDFNLGLENRLKREGLKTIHFVSPSIWAWRSKRVHKIGEAVDHVLCLFPFEPALYEQHGIAASYVGHPLADAIPLEPPRAASRAALGLADEGEVVALLPGSRRSEVEQIAPRLLAAAALMQAERPRLRFLLPVVPGLRPLVEPMVRTHAAGVRVELLDGRSHEALAACDLVLVASGTATLEAALFKRPMVITYAMNSLSWQIMKRMQLQPWVGLPNILLEEFVVPELLQQQATPRRIADAGLRWLDDPQACRTLAERFSGLHQRLRCNMAEAATRVIEDVIA